MELEARLLRKTEHYSLKIFDGKKYILVIDTDEELLFQYLNENEWSSIPSWLPLDAHLGVSYTLFNEETNEEVDLADPAYAEMIKQALLEIKIDRYGKEWIGRDGYEEYEDEYEDEESDDMKRDKEDQ